MWIILGTALSVLLIGSTTGQENAWTNVANSLQECYNNSFLSTKDNLLPTTMPVLIDLVRKMEETNPTSDARVLSYQILQRFRQDGIIKSSKEFDSSYGLPYTPKGVEASKNRIQLSVLTTGNALTFNNNSLTPIERCSIHSMISSSIDRKERGDESQVCNRISRYTSRIKRQSELAFDGTNHGSLCPLENGVVYTKWGGVKGGLVFAGIAAGFQPQNIRGENNENFNNIWASTIAGELAEVGLNQPTPNKIVGNKGGWNTTSDQKYYFLNNNNKENLLLTDAEIRGGLDGLYLGLNIDSWKNRMNKLKISQILDLYYSRGVMNDTIRACNRQILKNALAPTTELERQTKVFTYFFNEKVTNTFTPLKDAIPKIATDTVSTFNNYIPTLNDVACDSDLITERVATDLLIFIDTAWDYNNIEAIISTLLQNIDINRYESSYAVYNGANGGIIVNKTRHLVDFYQNYNLSVHQSQSSGFDYNLAVNVMENVYRSKLDNETDLTGQSTVVLLFPKSTPSDSQRGLVRDRRNNIFRRFLPDLRIFVGASGSRDAYNDLVYNPTNDIVLIPETTDESALKDASFSLIGKLQKLPRNVVNPFCKSNFAGGVTNFDLTQYVEPNGIVYHKISPNYFTPGRSLKVRGQGYGNIRVCSSRTEVNPTQNSTLSTCKNLRDDEYVIDVSGFCGDSVNDCSPIYIAVAGIDSAIRCNDDDCRFPDNIKYIITLEAGCTGSAPAIFSSIALIVTLIFALLRL